MTDLPTITAFRWVPQFARGFVRDIRPRWAFEEVGQPYRARLLDDAKGSDERRFQPFGQVPSYRDGEVEIFESGAIVLRIAERAGKLIPAGPAARTKAIQWLFAALNTVELPVMELTINDVFEADKPWSKDRHETVLGYLRPRLQDLQAALGEREWLEPDGFTVGDLMMVSVLGGLRGTGVLDAYPALSAYVSRGEDRPAHRKAMADHLADLETEPPQARSGAGR